MATKIPKFEYVRVLQAFYEFSGWEDLTEHNADKEGRKAIRNDAKAYRQNQPNFSYRIISRRNKIN